MKLSEKILDLLGEGFRSKLLPKGDNKKEVKDIQQKIRQLKSYEEGDKLYKEIEKMVDSGKLSPKEALKLTKSIDMKTAKYH